MAVEVDAGPDAVDGSELVLAPSSSEPEKECSDQSGAGKWSLSSSSEEKSSSESNVSCRVRPGDKK